MAYEDRTKLPKFRCLEKCSKCHSMCLREFGHNGKHLCRIHKHEAKED